MLLLLVLEEKVFLEMCLLDVMETRLVKMDSLREDRKNG